MGLAIPGISMDGGAALPQAVFRVPSGDSFEFLIGGIKEIDYATGVLGFQQSTIIRADSGTLTINAFTLGGTVTLDGQVLDAGSGDAKISTTGQWRGLRIEGTWDTNVAVTLTGYILSANPAANDRLLNLSGRGKDSAGNETEYAQIRLMIEDPTSDSEDGKIVMINISGGTPNDCLRLSSLGVLDVDASSGLGAATVGLFDEYDDALILKQGISEQALEKLEEVGVMSRKDTGSGWMVNVQAMMYLLAGGVYQNRARIDEQFVQLNNRLTKMELALPQGRN